MGAAGRSSGFFSPLIDSFSLRYTSTDISSLPHNKISHSQYKHKMAPLSPNWHTRGATDTKRRQETRSGSRPCAIQARFARPPPRRMAAWLLLSPPVASKTTPGSTVNRCGWGSKILRAVQEGAQAQLGFEQAKERWFGRRARTVHGNSISREFVKPRSSVQSLTGTHGTAPLQRRTSRQTRTLRDLRTIAGAADEAADGTRGNLMVNTRQRTGRRATLPSWISRWCVSSVVFLYFLTLPNL